MTQQNTLDTADKLPSWNDGAAKSAILDFVDQVMTKRSPAYRPASECIATFDNDGTLWCEYPNYM